MIDFAPSILNELPALADEYVAAHDLCEKQRERLKLHVGRFVVWRKDNGTHASDISAINGWLEHLANRHAPATVNNHRTSVLSVVRHATPDDEPLPRADRIRRQREPEKLSPALTIDEIRQLLKAAPKYKPMTKRTYGRGLAGDVIPRHRPDGVPWSIWWTAFVMVGYESGQYLSDLRLIRWDHVGRDGVVTFVRHKTGKAMSFRLSSDAIAAAKKIKSKELVVPWEFDMAAYFAREWRKFLRFAGVRDLGPKSLRRSAITYTYISQGEEAARILAGHASFATTARHYIDWSIARRPIIQPPPLNAT